jgi:hypothetical protein
MRGLAFGLALLPLAVSTSVSAAEAQPADGPPKAQKQKVSPRSAPPSLPLSSAESYATTHSADPPVLSAPKLASPATNSWTGVYVGGGVGAGRQ